MGNIFQNNRIIKSFAEFFNFASVTGLATREFSYCQSLEKVYLPLSVKTINQRAFESSLSLSDLKLNEGLTTFNGNYIFSGASSLIVLEFPSTLTNFTQSDIFQSCFIDVIDIPEGTTSLPNRMFCGTHATTKIVLPSTLTTLGTNVFRDSYASTIIVKSVTPPTLGSDAWLYGMASQIYVPDESVDAYKNSSVWSQKSSIIRPMSDYTD